MTMPADQLPEVMWRTLENLRAINDLRDKRRSVGIDVDREGPFEVTQLVNSFLGALAHPWEALFKGRTIDQTDDLTILLGHFDNAWTLSGEPVSIEVALGYLRNAFAHGNVQFLPNPASGEKDTDIGGVRLWNCRELPRKRGKPKMYEKNWEISLDIDSLWLVLKEFTDLSNRLYRPELVERSDDCNFEQQGISEKVTGSR